MNRNPEAVAISVHRPDDFDEFWAAGLAEIASHPLNAMVTEVPHRSTESVRVYDVSYTSYQGLRVSGWYATPRQAVGQLPALVTIPGYISEPVIPKYWASLGYAVLEVAPRGKLRSNDTFNPGYPGLLTHNIVDRETYGYRGFYLDVVRALDVLLDRPEIDPTRIGLQGHSQGGGLALVAAALRPEVIACLSTGAPYLCGITTAPTLTRSYPYEEITEYLREHPNDQQRVADAMAYYDGINFAPLVQAPTLMHLGLQDDVCPPETGFAVYRALAAEKQLHTFPNSAHEAGLPGLLPTIGAFLAQYLRPSDGMR